MAVLICPLCIGRTAGNCPCGSSSQPVSFKHEKSWSQPTPAIPQGIPYVAGKFLCNHCNQFRSLAVPREAAVQLVELSQHKDENGDLIRIMSCQTQNCPYQRQGVKQEVTLPPCPRCGFTQRLTQKGGPSDLPTPANDHDALRREIFGF